METGQTGGVNGMVESGWRAVCGEPVQGFDHTRLWMDLRRHKKTTSLSSLCAFPCDQISQMKSTLTPKKKPWRLFSGLEIYRFGSRRRAIKAGMEKKRQCDGDLWLMAGCFCDQQDWKEEKINPDLWKDANEKKNYINGQTSETGLEAQIR